MTPGLVALVLLAALLHASWNALVKGRDDRLAAIAIMSAGSAAISLCLLPFVPLPRPEAWPWLVASAATHIGYRIFLTRAYDHGDLSRVYPLARGAAPLIVAAVSAAFAYEYLSLPETVGVAILAAGIMLLALEGGIAPLLAAPRGVALSLATACFISAYTLLDGIGARTNGHALGFMVWLTLLDGLPLLAYAVWRKGKDAGALLADNWKAGLAAAVLSFTAYAIVIWAMTKAPIAPVAALRETSVVAAAIFGSLFFKERFGWARWLAVLCVAGGLAAMRLVG